MNANICKESIRISTKTLTLAPLRRTGFSISRHTLRAESYTTFELPWPKEFALVCRKTRTITILNLVVRYVRRVSYTTLSPSLASFYYFLEETPVTQWHNTLLC